MVPFPKQHFPQTTVSICYALSLHKVYKLAGKFINLLECLASSCNKTTPWEVFMVLVSLKRGGGKSWEGVVVVVGCDSTNFVKDLSPSPSPLPPHAPDFSTSSQVPNRQTLDIVYKLS